MAKILSLENKAIAIKYDSENKDFKTVNFIWHFLFKLI